MPKNVVIKRQMKFRLSEDDEPKGQGDYAVIPDAVYEAKPDWFQVVEDVPTDASDLEALTVEELRDQLRDRDLKVSGTKDELIDRLRG